MGILATPWRGNSAVEVKAQGIGEKVYVVMKVEKEQIYLHEKIPLTVRLYARGHSLRDIQYPLLSHPGFMVREFETPVRKMETLDGVEFETFEFRTTLFGLKTGRVKLGPVRIQSTILIPIDQRENSPLSRTPRDDYFGASATRPITLESNELSIHVLPFPEKGKPRGFDGAVGNFRMEVETQPEEVKVGEPMTLKITMSGAGNFDSLTPPDLEPVKGLKVYEAQVKRDNRVRIYEQVLIPESDEITEIPTIRLSFFNPEEVSYQTISKGPFPIRVRKAEDPRVFTGEILPLQKSPGSVKTRGDLLYRNRVFLLFHLLPLLFLLPVWLHHKQREKIRTDLRYARRLEARKQAKRGLQEGEKILKGGKASGYYDSFFKIFQDYLGNRFDLPSKSITVEEVDQILTPAGVDGQTLLKIRRIFFRCDLARYASAEFNRTEAEETFRMAKEVLNHLEGQKQNSRK